jgi:hypothetical protein
MFNYFDTLKKSLNNDVWKYVGKIYKYIAFLAKMGKSPWLKLGKFIHELYFGWFEKFSKYYFFSPV